MKTIDAYCSACDNEVRLVLTDEPIEDDPSPIHDREIVCLEIGEHCSGSMCPLGAVPPMVMAARLVKNGLQTSVQPIVKADCPACDNHTDFVVVSRQYAICAQCGTTASRQEIGKPAA